ncbi:hypothetical protein [uncultured Amnibacterium sp.]|uniref:hypothetical protein n=1 Tax=uncultured Amnibacterium sp. TaxID=1631851 RepID=UPI0035CB2425
MRRISYDGVAVATDDAVADAVIQLAIAIARYGRYEPVTIPVLVDGRGEELTLMLGPTIHISSLTFPSPPGVVVDGAEAAASGIRARIRALDGPLHLIDGGPQDQAVS